jgi:hypothetical protein
MCRSLSAAVTTSRERYRLLKDLSEGLGIIQEPALSQAPVAERPIALPPEGTGAAKCAGFSRITLGCLTPTRSVF